VSQGFDGSGDNDEPGDPAGDQPQGLDRGADEGPSDDGPPRTGDPAVDAALATAAAVRGAEPAEQLETYVGTHRSLQERLADSGA
jgi:hypothetical protein